VYCLAQAGFKGFLWLPPEFALDFGSIYGVAQVVAGSI
jgi:hypothetical protein